jgi:hypothetical protein
MVQGLSFHLSLPICPDTGQLFWIDDTESKTYKINFEEFVVPLRFRHCISIKGKHMAVYAYDIYTPGQPISAGLLLHFFPNWNTIKDDILMDSQNWTEEDHDDFHKAVAWFASKHVFDVSWN